MVQSAWQCPHLTSLRLINVPSICGADTAAARCTGLRQLQLQACSFDDEPISSALCSMLGQLTSLAFLGSDSFRVPSQFSALRWGRCRAGRIAARGGNVLSSCMFQLLLAMHSAAMHPGPQSQLAAAVVF